jgi:hypothetical protein
MAEKARRFRFMSHFHGEPLQTELAVDGEELLEVIQTNRLRNRTTYVVRCRKA